MNFQHLTGSYFDSLAQSHGLRTVRLRLNNGTEIIPTPLMGHLGQVASTDIGFELEDPELLDTWETSIPISTLASTLGASWKVLVGADQLWEIYNGEWKVYRTYGLPQYSNADAGGRVKLVFKADANNADSLGLEAPYVP